MTNPNLTICVPIAPGESDVEFPEEEEDEETESSEDEEHKSVRVYERWFISLVLGIWFIRFLRLCSLTHKQIIDMSRLMHWSKTLTGLSQMNEMVIWIGL